ncbi:ThuA domain-containing protein [Streptomyces sp. NPDC001858]
MFTPAAARLWPRSLLRLFTLLAVLLGLQTGVPQTARAAADFKVLAFYGGTEDQAHISFDKEANSWFPQAGAQYGFSYTATTDWNQLNTANLANYQVVMFLDDYPHTAAQRSAFQTYMNNGGGFLGFHVSAFTTDSSDWSWYHNTLLGTGAFRNNTWWPTAETLTIDDRTHAATAGLPATITSSVSEWYSWQNDLRQNPAIDILASMAPSTFPVGTDANQSWYSGYYPIAWTNRNYKMFYANFGHNYMDYSTDTALSSTFASAQQNQLLIQGLRWLGGQSGPVPPPTEPTGAIHGYGGKCVDVAGANSANGTAVQLYDCNGTGAQNWTVATDGSLRSLGKCMDIASAGTANGTKVQLYDCNGTGAQKWQPGANGSLVNPVSGKCLDATGPSSDNGTRLQIWTCNGAANQSWTLPS